MLAERANEVPANCCGSNGQRALGVRRGVPEDTVLRAILDVRFVVGEEEQPVLDDRTAKRGAILLALQTGSSTGGCSCWK